MKGGCHLKGWPIISAESKEGNVGLRCALYIILALSLSLLCFSWPCFARDLTNARKRQIVYDMYARYHQAFPEVRDISPREAMALVESGKVVFVDTRDREEQQVSMLPGAVTEKAFEKNPGQYKDHIVIGYCTISYRSGKLARKLKERGIEMLNLKGGMLAWVHEGGKVYDAKGETRRVHVYSKKWNYLPGGYEAVW